jgi:curli production assembly/transport component CsgE
VDGKQTVSCWCINNEVLPVTLQYKAVLSTGGQREVKEGSTMAMPGQATLLLKGIFVIPDGNFDHVTLEVFENKKLVAQSSLLGPPKQEPANLTEATDTAPTPAKASPLESLEIEGLILDETRSKLAHDFYELFYNGWTDVEGTVGSVTVTIREQPNRIGIGSLVAVEVDGQEIAQLNLQPRIEVLENLAAQLVEALKNHLENPQGGQEIETDDLNGSGIY